jgi:ElaB/YqjD/DUF883 family membrane-anchored ribosome-binding protein
MTQTVLETPAEHVAASTGYASCATSAVADAIGNGVGVAKRAVEHSREAAQEFLHDTSQRIQRNPGTTVATTFAVGLAAGALIGWTMKRK